MVTSIGSTTSAEKENFNYDGSQRISTSQKRLATHYENMTATYSSTTNTYRNTSTTAQASLVCCQTSSSYITNKDNKLAANFLNTTIYILQPNKSNNNYTTNHNLQSKKQAELRSFAKKYKIKQNGTKPQLIARLIEHLYPQYYLFQKNLLWNIKTYNKKQDLKVNFRPNLFSHYTS